MKQFFENVKKQLEKSEDEFIFPGQKASVGKAKLAQKEKKLFRFLHSQLTGQIGSDYRVSKPEFFALVKQFIRLNDVESLDLMLYFGKKLVPAQAGEESKTPNQKKRMSKFAKRPTTSQTKA